MAQDFSGRGDVAGSDTLRKSGVLTPSLPQDIGVRSQRQRILEAMAKSCAEKTYSATTIADIVGCASISRGTFYKHFSNKQECFYATADTFLVDLQGTAAIAHARSEGDLPAEAVRDAIAAVLDGLASRPAQAKMLLVEAPIVDPEIVRRYRDSVIEAVEGQLRAGGIAGGARANPEIAFGRAKLLIADYVAAGQVKELPTLLPELVYIALLPYAGQDAALAQALAQTDR
jgi:AcrR family transcriptional regulator